MSGEAMKPKPCPFCGESPLLDNVSLTGRIRYFWVACRNQKCTVLPSGMQCVSEQDAIASWNQRKVKTKIQWRAQAALEAVKR